MLTTQQAADILGVGASTVRAWAASGRLRAVKLGKTYILTERDVRAFQKPRPGRPRGSRRPLSGPTVWTEEDEAALQAELATRGKAA
jgi:excisionase family DNA binding protein